MAGVLIKLGGGFGSYDIIGLNCEGGAGPDAARINLTEQGPSPGDSIIQRVFISARLGATTGTPTASAPPAGYGARWGIILGNLDSELPAAITAVGETPWGSRFGVGSVYSGATPPTFKNVNRLLLCGYVFADVAPPPPLILPDDPSSPGALIIPSGQPCQLVILGTLLPQLPTGLTQWSLDLYVNVLGGVIAGRGNRPILPDRLPTNLR